MRTYKVLASITTSLAACLLTLYFGRQHITELSRTLQTYLSFQSHLKSHPEQLFQYDNSTRVDRASWLVPPIIHQISLTDGRDVSPQTYFEAANTSCRRLHNDWDYYFWTDESASAFMQQYYPKLWPHYKGYRRTIQRANILRYALLDHYGGVYLDLDLTCPQPLDGMMHLPWLAPAAYPVGISNGFMMSRPGHPFMKYLLDHVPFSDLRWGLPYLETMLSTGCMFSSNHFLWYSDKRLGRGIGLARENKLYILADEYGNTASHMLHGHVTTPLFQHHGSSSWHEWDASVFILIGEHYWCFVTFFILGALLSVARIWWCCREVRTSGYAYQHVAIRKEKATVRSSEADACLV